MAVPAMASWAASVHEDIFYSAIVKAFAEEEWNIITKKYRDQPRKEDGAIYLITGMN